MGCCIQVPSDCTGIHYHSCTKPVVDTVDGKDYCKIHHPDEVKKRRKKSEKAWKIKWNKERYHVHGRKFFAVLQKIADGHPNPQKLAKICIREFKEGEK